jgi:hypothetical protein
MGVKSRCEIRPGKHAARARSPKKRYLTPFSAQFFNKYAYVGNEPTRMTDPLGLQTCSTFCYDPYYAIEFPGQCVGCPGALAGVDPCTDPFYATTHAECGGRSGGPINISFGCGGGWGGGGGEEDPRGIACKMCKADCQVRYAAALALCFLPVVTPGGGIMVWECVEEATQGFNRCMNDCLTGPCGQPSGLPPRGLGTGVKLYSGRYQKVPGS